jgi:hypothetical protein
MQSVNNRIYMPCPAIFLTDRDSLSSALAKKPKQGILVHWISPANFAVHKDDCGKYAKAGKVS